MHPSSGPTSWVPCPLSSLAVNFLTAESGLISAPPGRVCRGPPQTFFERLNEGLTEMRQGWHPGYRSKLPPLAPQFLAQTKSGLSFHLTISDL